ncbi:hypothetical protein RAH32_02890 [Paracoccus sp. WLY502]|uniref:hypothetical protein n=1 Tax=Paracoccus yibinensis TaxID=3068891 RepID=UPI0027969F46|nr:hypothetical protein [Paracoccus sp. WLY502]MDQ1899392.1 hypothetical protein [Paracoccus sp. WLY502]
MNDPFQFAVALQKSRPKDQTQSRRRHGAAHRVLAQSQEGQDEQDDDDQADDVDDRVHGNGSFVLTAMPVSWKGCGPACALRAIERLTV